MGGQNSLIQAYLNVHGQTGLPVTKQKQIEDFIRRNKIDILHCPEINIDEETFSQCNARLSFLILQILLLKMYIFILGQMVCQEGLNYSSTSS